MNTDRIKEIQEKTAYPNSVSVQQALLQVWNECQEDMADEIVNFHEWIRLSKPSELRHVGNVNGKCYDYKREYYTTKELFNIYKSLNKQD